MIRLRIRASSAGSGFLGLTQISGQSTFTKTGGNGWKPGYVAVCDGLCGHFACGVWTKRLNDHSPNSQARAGLTSPACRLPLAAVPVATPRGSWVAGCRSPWGGVRGVREPLEPAHPAPGVSHRMPCTANLRSVDLGEPPGSRHHGFHSKCKLLRWLLFCCSCNTSVKPASLTGRPFSHLQQLIPRFAPFSPNLMC